MAPQPESAPPAASDNRRALPALAEHVLVQERDDRLAPDDAVARLEDPVVLGGEPTEETKEALYGTKQYDEYAVATDTGTLCAANHPAIPGWDRKCARRYRQ
jgi:hypothetical protein